MEAQSLEVTHNHVRFHLANGPHFGHWQIKGFNHALVKQLRYLNPKNGIMVMKFNVKLHNRPSTAKGIFDGKNKTVCAWICADHVDIVDYMPQDLLQLIIDRMPQLRYNPREQPYWVNAAGENIDHNTYGSITAIGTSLYDTTDIWK